MQNERQHKAERGRARAVCRECSAAARPHAPSRMSQLYERQASKATSKLDKVAAASVADAAARRVPSTQCIDTANVRGLDRAVPRTHSSTGVGTACQARLHRPSSGGRPSRGSGKRSRRNVHVAQARYTARQLPNSCGMHHRTSSRLRTAEGSMPDTSSSRSPCSSSRCSD